jgi:hypothetical protein
MTKRELLNLGSADYEWQRSNRARVSLTHRGWQTISLDKGCLLAHRWLVRQTDYTYHVSTPCNEWGEFKRMNVTLASNRTRPIVLR